MRSCRTLSLKPLTLIVALAVPLAHEPISAQAPQASASLSLNDAVERALADNPGLRAAGYAVDIAEAQRDGASLRPQFNIEAEMENFLGNDPYNGVSNAETTLQVSRVLELGDKRDLRIAAGEARVDLAEAEQERARLDLVSRLASAFVELVVVQEQRSLAAEAIAVATVTRELVLRRTNAGSGSEAELVSADIALERARLEYSLHDSEHAIARAAIAAFWGGDATDFDAAAGELLMFPELPALAAVEERIAGNPDLLRFVDEQRILEAERQLSLAQRNRDLELSLGVRHLGDVDAAALVFGIGMPIGMARRAESGIREADTRLEQLPVALEQHRLDVLSTVRRLYRQLEFAGVEFSVLQNEILPRAEHAVDLYRQGFEVGSYSLLELSDAQTDLLELRHELIDVAARYHLSLVALEQLLGGSVTGGI